MPEIRAFKKIIIGWVESGKAIWNKTYYLGLQSLCLKKGTPTLSTVTLERINGF